MSATQFLSKPDIKISVKQSFGLDSELEVQGFSKKNEFVPKVDPDYKFDRDTTLAILAGFSFNKRVLIQGYHGTGKSTHIEQVAARLNWPCIRVNLDSHISRIDLIGKDAIVLKDGKQVTEFKEGILPWSIQNPIALVFDEYDAGRPDVMFVIQRVLESDGSFTLLDKNKVLDQHDFFRMFATTNTVGLGDTTGLYHGTQQINQGQMDRWNIVSTLNYLNHEKELEIILAKNKNDEVFNLEKLDLLNYLKQQMQGICDIDKLERHMVFPLGQGIASQVSLPGAILLGDAGFAIPPVGAQGLNLAFFDIAVLTDLLAKAIENNMSFSDKEISERFNQTVMPHHEKLLKGVKALMTVFDIHATWLQSLHGLALKLANYIPPFKHYIAEFGMGFRYPMPSLIRGQMPKVYPKVIRDNEVNSRV